MYAVSCYSSQTVVYPVLAFAPLKQSTRNPLYLSNIKTAPRMNSLCNTDQTDWNYLIGTICIDRPHCHSLRAPILRRLNLHLLLPELECPTTTALHCTAQHATNQTESVDQLHGYVCVGTIMPEKHHLHPAPTIPVIYASPTCFSRSKLVLRRHRAAGVATS
jgi:hypothetical protein